MASHHHHCHHSPAAAASCYSHCCHPTYTPCHHHPPPPPPDPHLHHPPHPPHFYSPSSHPQNLPQHFQENNIEERSPPHPTVSSLLRRIAALESALRRRASPAQSLRDAASRSIQAHFRAFLVRRSITLRHLKDLASIKSNLGFLKSSVSEKTHFDYDIVYHKAVTLLLKLDAIQGGDPMIRNGKSSLNREIYRFLDFIEGVCVQRRTIGVNERSRVSNCEKKIGNVESGCSKRVNVEKLRGLVERIDRLAEELDEEQGDEIENPNDEFVMRKYDVSASPTGGLVKQHGGVRPKVKKNVTFAENGKVYKVLRRHSQPYLEEYSNESIDKEDLDDDADEKEFEEEIGVSPKEDVEEEVEDGSSSSDGEKVLKHSSIRGGKFGMRSEQDDDTGGSVFSAPLPAKMERRSN